MYIIPRSSFNHVSLTPSSGINLFLEKEEFLHRHAGFKVAGSNGGKWLNVTGNYRLSAGDDWEDRWTSPGLETKEGRWRGRE